ncbi:MAG TPA: hypothetical protein VJ801_01500, partial [Polyangia bacterium]|nr:hypothetical protein [Polyangia bacterium]
MLRSFLGERLALLSVLLALPGGCQKASGAELHASKASRFGSELHQKAGTRNPAALKPAPATLKLKLSVENPVVALGEGIRLRLEIVNETKRAIHFDDGCLIAYEIVRDERGVEIPQWPFMDILAAPPGKEVLWSLPGGKRETRNLVLGFRHASWSGFGIPDGQYQGHAIEVGQQAGSAIHAIGKVPAKVSVLVRWIADLQSVRSRARELGVAP